MQPTVDLGAMMRDAAALNRRIMRTRASLRGGDVDVMADVRDLAVRRSRYVQDQLTPATIAAMHSVEEVFGEEAPPERVAAPLSPNPNVSVSPKQAATPSTVDEQVKAIEDVMYDRIVVDVVPEMPSEPSVLESIEQKIQALSQTFQDVLNKMSVDQVYKGVREAAANRAVLYVAQQSSSPILKTLLVTHLMHPLDKERVWVKVSKAIARKLGTNLNEDDIQTVNAFVVAADNIYTNAFTLARAFILDTPASLAIDFLQITINKIATMAVEAYLDLPDVQPEVAKAQLVGGADQTWSELLNQVCNEYADEIKLGAKLCFVLGARTMIDTVIPNLSSFLIASCISVGFQYAGHRIFEEEYTTGKQVGVALVGATVGTATMASLSPGLLPGILAFFNQMTFTSLTSMVSAALYAAVKGVVTGVASVLSNPTLLSALFKLFWIGVQSYGTLLLGVCKAMLSVAMMNLWLTGAVVAGGGVVYVAYQAYLKLCALWYERPIAFLKQTFGMGVTVTTQYSTWSEDIKFWIREYFRILLSIPFDLTNTVIKWAANLASDYVLNPLLERLSSWFASNSSSWDPLLAKIEVGVDAAKLLFILTIVIGGVSTAVTATGVVAPIMSAAVSGLTAVLSAVGLAGGSESGVIVFAGGNQPMPDAMWGIDWFAATLSGGRCGARIQRPLTLMTGGYCNESGGARHGVRRIRGGIRGGTHPNHVGTLVLTRLH